MRRYLIKGLGILAFKSGNNAADIGAISVYDKPLFSNIKRNKNGYDDISILTHFKPSVRLQMKMIFS